MSTTTLRVRRHRLYAAGRIDTLLVRALLVRALLASLWFPSAGNAAATLISATLEPHEITIGQSAALTITTLGKDLGGLTPPSVGGLEFRIVGQTHRTDNVQGASVVFTVTTIRVTPLISGDFQIPGMADGAPAMQLRVEADESVVTPRRAPAAPTALVAPTAPTAPAAPTASTLPNAPNRPGASKASTVPKPSPASTASAASTASTAQLKDLHLTADGAAFVRLSLPKREVYVGESVPVDIEVGLRPGVITSLNGLPTLTSVDFTLNNLSRQPERGERDIDGSHFSLLTWHSVLAPVKPGTFTLSVETPVTMRIRLTSAADARLDNLLGDPFMQNYYGKSNKKDIKIGSPPATLTVLGLPAAGRPANFSGAVGTFIVSSDIASGDAAQAGRAAVGDPLTLRLRVSGSGNFDRVDSAMLEHLEHWKTYPPKASFKPADSIGHAGEKTFEQPLIASQAGAQTLPRIPFSYFDPQARHYVTVETASLAVTITPALAESPIGAPTAHVDAGAGPSPAAPATPAQNGLRPDHALAGPVVHTLMPLYLQQRFATIPAAIALLFAAGWWQTGRQRGLKNGNARPSAAVQRAMAEVEAAARAGNAAVFFAAARAAVRLALADRWHTAAGTVNEALVATRLGSAGREIAELFRIADELQYSGAAPAAADLGRWTGIVRRELTRGEVP